MATIAPLAIKIMANIADLETKFNTINSSIGYMVKVAQNATPSMKNLEDAVEGVSTMYQAVSEAANNVGTEAFGGFIDEQVASLRAAEDAAEKVQQAVQRMGEGVADDILNLKPTLENIYVAQQQVKKLEELQQRLAAGGGDASILNGAIEKAKANVGQLATNTAALKVEMMGLNSVIFALNQLPFTILMSVFKDVKDIVGSFASSINQHFNGVPGLILKIVAGLTALVVVIGLTQTKMAALGGQTTYFMALWNSSMIMQGLRGFWTLLDGTRARIILCTVGTYAWAAAQAVLNTVMAMNPLGLIVVVLAAIIALVAAVVWWFSSSAAKAEEMKNRIADMEKSTAAFRDRMGEAVNRYKELNNLAKQYHEANLTGAQKYQNKLKEVDEVLNKQNTAKNMEAQFDSKYDAMKAAWNNAKATEEKNAIAEQMKKLVEDWEGFRKELKNAPQLSAADAAAVKEAARLEYLKNRYGNLIEATLTPQQQYTDTLKNLAEDLKAGRILQNEYNNAAAKAKAELEKNDPVIQARRKKEEEINKQYQQLVDKFKGMVPEKSPVEAFKELTEQLIAVRRTLSKEEYANAQKKMLDDLAKGLGVDQYLKPDDSLMTSQQKLADVYSRLAEYQQNSAMTAGELAEAQKRAAAALEKQSPMYALMQEAQKKLMMSDDKLRAAKQAEALAAIEREAKIWSWDTETVKMMKELKAKEFQTDKVDEVDEGEKRKPEVKQASNAAIEKGTAAYLDFVRKNQNDPVLKESQRQTKVMQQIAKNTTPKQENNEQITIIA